MSNQKKVNGANEEVVNQEAQKEENVQQNPQTEQQVAEQQKKGGFGAWCKKHWKGIVAGVTGVLTVGGSAVIAYKKGKAAGIMSVPMPQAEEQEDYSLNPNE